MFYIVYIVRFQESTCLNLDVSKFSELFHDSALWKLAFRVPTDILRFKIVSIHLSFHSFADGFLFNIESSDSAIDRVENILIFTWDKINFPNNSVFWIWKLNYDAFKVLLFFLRSRFFYFLEREVLIIFNLDFFVVLIIFSMHLFSFFFFFIFFLPLLFCFYIFLFLLKLFLFFLVIAITFPLISFDDFNTLHVHFCVGFVLLKLLQSHL